jgi:poly-gamma-glutamate capsule biosynthesis protein CapA/YwtB (metallophosphatase superfamily)
MATEHKSSDTGVGVDPQTPAARRAHPEPEPGTGSELAELEASAAEQLEVQPMEICPGVEASEQPAPRAHARTTPRPPAHPQPSDGPPTQPPQPSAPPPTQPSAPPRPIEPSAPAHPSLPSAPAHPTQPSAPPPPQPSPQATPTEPSAPAPPQPSAPATPPQPSPPPPTQSTAPTEPAPPTKRTAPAPPRAPAPPKQPTAPPRARTGGPPPGRPVLRHPRRRPGASYAPRRGAPSALPPRPAPPVQRGRAVTRERVTALVALASAVGVLLFMLASVGSSGEGPKGLGDFGATASARVVAPGGWIALAGSDAPAAATVLLETRGDNGDWRTAARSSTDDQGGFRVEGRVLGHPGRLDIRARVPGVGASAPLPVTVRPLRLASVGDINLGDVPGEAIAANGPRWPWTSVGRRLRAADIAFGNLECAISRRGEPFPKEFTFRGTPQALRGLRRNTGMDVLNLANNHVGDYGRAAMLDTVRGVERFGMRAVGAGSDLRRALAPQVVERLGLRVAFVGFSEIAPIEFAATDETPGTAWATPESVAAAVRAARRRADVVVATFHWGIEKAPYESAAQQTLAHTAAAAGAHLVIGAHPHVLQPVRREGAALVAYSLGNFVFGASSSDTTATGILEVGLTAEGVASARWRRARIVSGRPVLDRRRPRRIPVRKRAAMDAGVTL